MSHGPNTNDKADCVISVSGVSKSYKKLKALNDISFNVSRGEIFGLIGPDGAGKSTLIHIMTGVLDFTEGDVRLLGTDIKREAESIKTSIGFLPQGLGLSLAQELSVEENIDYFASINQLDKRTRNERKEKLLKATQLDRFKDRQAKNLSGGMKQKLALCCTLIHEPPILFLDEPTTGVDPISRSDLWTLINATVKEKGMTIFLTTSYMDEAARCHDIILMHKGTVVERGTPDSLPSKLDGKFAEIIVGNLEQQQSALRILKRMPAIKSIYPMGDRLNCVYSGASTSDIKKYSAENNIDVHQVVEATAGIEDVFLSKIAQKSEGIDESVFEEFFSDRRPGGEGSRKSSGNTMIEVRDLVKRFGDFAAVDRVSFDVKSGEIFGFLGPNGAGKTTTIKMLCGLFPPTSGAGRIGGFDIFKEQFSIKKSIGYMSQKFSLYRDLTVSENIVLYGGIYGVERMELLRRKDLILKIAGLAGEGDAMTGELPMGIKQRLALGCAIIHKPSCIFLDEPTSGVDPIARRQFWDIIYLLSRRMGVTILVTTHYMDEAEHCDRLSLMTNGKLVALGAPGELKSGVTDKIGTLLVVGTSDPFHSVDVLKKSFEYCIIFGADVHLYTANPESDIPRIKEDLRENGIEIKDLRRSAIPFEDVFVYFCEKASS